MNDMTKNTAIRRNERAPQGFGGLFYGVYPAVVTETQDPDGLGRVKVALPWMAAEDGPELWARLATLSTGPGYGSWFPPRTGSEVLVAFEAGDVAHPFVIGMLWNGVEPPPAISDKPGNETQVLSTPRGTRVVFDENATGGALRLETADGQRLTLNDAPDGVVIEDATGAKITLSGGNITIEASAKVEVKASQIDLSAGVITLDSAMVLASGMVKCTTLQTETVIATTYTPGAGNIW